MEILLQNENGSVRVVTVKNTLPDPARPLRVPSWDGKSMMWSDVSKSWIPEFAATVYEFKGRTDRDGRPIFE